MFFTYSGHDSVCAGATAGLDIIDREGLVERAATMGSYLRTALDSRIAPHARVTEVRGRGLMQGIGLQGATAADVVAECLTRDLWVYPAGSGGSTGDAIILAPPLIIDEPVIDLIVERLSDALDALV